MSHIQRTVIAARKAAKSNTNTKITPELFLCMYAHVRETPKSYSNADMMPRIDNI